MIVAAWYGGFAPWLLGALAKFLFRFPAAARYEGRDAER